jgi:hypothetical protein
MHDLMQRREAWYFLLRFERVCTHPRTIVASRTLHLAFFDRWLRGQHNHLLDGPSPRYPQIIFVR